MSLVLTPFIFLGFERHPDSVSVERFLQRNFKFYFWTFATSSDFNVIEVMRLILWLCYYLKHVFYPTMVHCCLYGCKQSWYPVELHGFIFIFQRKMDCDRDGKISAQDLSNTVAKAFGECLPYSKEKYSQILHLKLISIFMQTFFMLWIFLIALFDFMGHFLDTMPVCQYNLDLPYLKQSMSLL